MNSPLNDPRFPNRPSHPDFWRLSECILAMDGRVEEAPLDKKGEALESLITEHIDMDSAAYMASMRMMRWAGIYGIPWEYGPALATAYLEGIVLGIRFEKAGGKQGV